VRRVFVVRAVPAKEGNRDGVVAGGGGGVVKDGDGRGGRAPGSIDGECCDVVEVGKLL
jgi:hypothetical protein